MRRDLLSVMLLVRDQLYLPDGKPPTGYDENRDWGIAKRLVAQFGADETLDAIRGLVELRDTGLLPFPAGSKLTLRLLVSNKAGDHNWFHSSRIAWRRHEQKTLAPTMASIGHLLNEAQRRA